MASSGSKFVPSPSGWSHRLLFTINGTRTDHQYSRKPTTETMSVQLPTHYAQRAEQLEFASPQTIREALADPNTVVLDVRSDEEVEATGHLAHPKFAATSCHACRKMDETAHKMAPSKEGKQPSASRLLQILRS